MFLINNLLDIGKCVPFFLSCKMRKSSTLTGNADNWQGAGSPLQMHQINVNRTCLTVKVWHVWLLKLETAGRLGCVSRRGHSQHCDKDLGSQKNISLLWHLKRRCWLNFWNVTPNWQRGPLWLNDSWRLYSEGRKHPSSWKKDKKNNVNICDSMKTSVGQEWLRSVFIYALQSGAPSVFVLELYMLRLC